MTSLYLKLKLDLDNWDYWKSYKTDKSALQAVTNMEWLREHVHLIQLRSASNSTYLVEDAINEFKKMK